ncbi:universal stress protein [Prochlorococcus sp. MIT 1307]|uniref:universal stress protein n=1 Tax=Prochlorococcus sp. MIT 1307 TaxID=3096219 RepID=UPI002A75CF4E|nr:universal stress protein [Prochlorococcus sp. MIT 1307]
MFKSLLFPIDQSRQTFETAKAAIQIAQNHQSQITLLSVLQVEGTEMDRTQLITSLLNRVKEQIEQAGVSCNVLEKQGTPAFVICDVADDLNMDLIVMGTRGINLEKDNKSTAARVIQLAPCPVLVVP